MTSRPFNVAEREYVIQRIETAFDSPFSGSVYGGYNYVHPYNTCPNGVSYITLIMLSRVHPEQIQALHEIEGDWNQLTVAQLAKELVTATDELIARSLLLLP